MSAILKICQNMYTNDVSLQCLKVLRLRTQFMTSSLFPKNVQPNIALLYVKSLSLILTF